MQFSALFFLSLVKRYRGESEELLLSIIEFMFSNEYNRVYFLRRPWRASVAWLSLEMLQSLHMALARSLTVLVFPAGPESRRSLWRVAVWGSRCICRWAGWWRGCRWDSARRRSGRNWCTGGWMHRLLCGPIGTRAQRGWSLWRYRERGHRRWWECWSSCKRASRGSSGWGR